MKLKIFTLAAFILLGATTIPVQTVSAQTIESVEITKQKLLLELIHQLQETLLKLERQVTIERGQTPGENLINQSSVANTNAEVRLYQTPSYEAEYQTQAADEMGEVSAGPKLIDGEVWWKFDFLDGKSGWSPEQYFTREPSVVLRADTDGDGTHDIKFRFIGEYDVTQFYSEITEEGTVIRYRGDSGVEPFSITEL